MLDNVWGFTFITMYAVRILRPFQSCNTNRTMAQHWYKVVLLVRVIHVACQTHGLELNTFMAKHQTAMEEYIMTGHGNGWTHCDIFSAFPERKTNLEHIPQVTIDIEHLKSIDIGATLSSSHCILAMYEVGSRENLESLMELGRRAIEHKRIALVIKLGTGLSLLDSKKLPFMIAALHENGKEEFICPSGENVIQSRICDKSSLTLSGKTLHVGILGVGPYFIGEE